MRFLQYRGFEKYQSISRRRQPNQPGDSQITVAKLAYESDVRRECRTSSPVDASGMGRS